MSTGIITIVFGWQSDTEYYYAHISQDSTMHAHNGPPPAITDKEWHDVRVVHCAGTGEIAVWVDGHDTPS